MASNTSFLKKRSNVEETINRWNLDFYVFKAFEAFRDEDYKSFIQFRNHIETLIVRPMDAASDTSIKLRFIQFLAQINDGDKLDFTFQSPLTPLESALNVLECIRTEMDVPQMSVARVSTTIREMLVKICIRSKEFEKADEMLRKYFSKGRDSDGKKKLYMDLIQKRCSTHSTFGENSYNDFKQDMLDFMEKLYIIPEPFLVKMALKSIPGCSVDARGSKKPNAIWKVNEESSAMDRTMQDAELPTEQTVAPHSVPSSKPNMQSRKYNSGRPPSSSSPSLLLSLDQVKAFYAELAKLFIVSVPFSNLEEEVEKEAQEWSRTELDPGELGLRLSETPMEEILHKEEKNDHKERSSEADFESCASQQDAEQDCSGQPLTAGKTEANHEQIDPSGIPDSHNGSKIKDVIKLASESDPAPSPSPSKKRAKGPGGAVAAVTVAQLVTEEDSQLSDSDATSPAQTSSSPVKGGSRVEDPLNSLPTNTTPVRKYRRSVTNRKSIPSEPEPSSPQQPTDSQSSSTPSMVDSPVQPPSSPFLGKSTPVKRPKKATSKRQHIDSEDGSDAVMTDSPASTKRLKRSVPVSPGRLNQQSMTFILMASQLLVFLVMPGLNYP